MAVFTKIGRSIPSSATVPVAGDDSIKSRLLKWEIKREIKNLFQLPTIFSIFDIHGHDPDTRGSTGWPPKFGSPEYDRWLRDNAGWLTVDPTSGAGAKIVSSAFADP